MSTTQRLSVTRCILFGGGAANLGNGGFNNKLFGKKLYVYELEKWRYRNVKKNKDATNRLTFVYCARDNRLCRQAFATLFGLNEHNITHHDSTVALALKFLLYETKLSQSHVGKIEEHRHIVVEFLTYSTSNYGPECPTGPRSGEESTLTILPSNMLKLTSTMTTLPTLQILKLLHVNMMWVLVRNRFPTFHSSSTGGRHTQRYILQNLDHLFSIFVRCYRTTQKGFVCKILSTAVFLSCRAAQKRSLLDTRKLKEIFYRVPKFFF